MTTTLYLVLLGLGLIAALFHRIEDGDGGGPSNGSGGGPRRLAKVPVRSNRPASRK